MRDIGARGANEHRSSPKDGQDDKPKTQPTSPCAQKTRMCRPSQETRARPEINPNPTLYPELQPNYSTYFAGAQYAPVVVHMPALVMHVKIAPTTNPNSPCNSRLHRHQHRPARSRAPTLMPTASRAM